VDQSFPLFLPLFPLEPDIYNEEGYPKPLMPNGLMGLMPTTNGQVETALKSVCVCVRERERIAVDPLIN
jgi:hypothetical protein